MKNPILIVALLLSSFVQLSAQQEQTDISLKDLSEQLSSMRHTFDALEKKLDDVLWYDKVGDVAYIDKVVLTGPPKPDRVEKTTMMMSMFWKSST